MRDTTHSFDSYHIYSSPNATVPFTEVDSILNVNNTTYTHIGAGANTHSIYYYLKTKSGCGGRDPSPSDTIMTILINVVNTGTGTALINWNALHNPNLPTLLWVVLSLQGIPHRCMGNDRFHTKFIIY